MTEFSTMDEKFRHVFLPVEEQEPEKHKKSDVPERAASSLARVGLTLEEARSLTDEQLLAIPGVGEGAVKLMRDHPDLVRSKRASTNEAIGV